MKVVIGDDGYGGRLDQAGSCSRLQSLFLNHRLCFWFGIWNRIEIYNFYIFERTKVFGRKFNGNII